MVVSNVSCITNGICFMDDYGRRKKRSYRSVSYTHLWQVVDALSEYSFYEKGIVQHPIVSSNHISFFLKNKVPQPWVYYCCGQSVTVPNRFFAMPSWRNRIMGVLMYLHGIKGFLHWGFNFYNSQYSRCV